MLSYTAKSTQGIVDIFISGKCQALYIAEIEQSFWDDFHQWVQSGSQLHFHIDNLEFFDTAGAWFITKVLKRAKSVGITTELTATPAQNHQISPLMTMQTIVPPMMSGTGDKNVVEYIGQQTMVVWQSFEGLVHFLGEICVLISHTILKIKTWRWTSIIHHMDIVGVRALPIIGLISFLIGAVLAYQGINQLARFGAQIYAVDFLAISILREIAVLMTAIVVAGRSGSSFAAQIGTMALNQEIDAIRVLGLNPLMILVLPRMIALFLALPLLVFFSMIMGLIGGMMISMLIIDLSPLQFWSSFHKSISPSTFWVGISKAPFFAIIISLVGCYRGMQVKGSAESVGLMTTRAVVESIFLVIVVDALMSIFFSSLDI